MVPRIFHPERLTDGETVTLDESAARHVARVLRLNPGGQLILFDGTGGEFNAVIREIGKRRVMAELGTRQHVETESPLRITLAQGISRGDRMDFTIQKAVELGVSRIVPLSTERSVVNLKGQRLEKKLAHWQGIIISACEQCGRNTLPQLLPMQSLARWLEDDGAKGTGVLLDHRANATIATLSLPPGVALTLLIGPEGGLSGTEQERALVAGYQGLRLGPRVLRTETAALAALAALQSRFGDLR
ncbi:MAG: 16S rRNA (uracil(1498)-N(3))-methyltransferase [Gammaproteobacteria bacterium]|nr:16S rRNA (uracil(1498)-N(3))-methyltransferase [Gammaproteobacteria bacterium]MCW9089322.1 16S rRNA (uracil(1498)-N(3))-methyltransferase [Gammaproteobacteria bacterium]